MRHNEYWYEIGDCAHCRNLPRWGYNCEYGEPGLTNPHHCCGFEPEVDTDAHQNEECGDN